MQCSTPFGIEDTFTAIVTSRTNIFRVCSTPFGIEDTFTHRTKAEMNADLMCSTPFGIEDTFTSSHGTPCTETKSAQRLSASKIPSQILGHDVDRRLRVLNAFRHRRYLHTFSTLGMVWGLKCSTPFGIEDTFTHLAICELHR